MFASTRKHGVGGNDIYVTDRDSLTSSWNPPVILPAPINSQTADFCPTRIRPLFAFRQRPPTNAGTTRLVEAGHLPVQAESERRLDEPPLLECYPQGPNFPGRRAQSIAGADIFRTLLFYSSTAWH
jgi:hypothetical protein